METIYQATPEKYTAIVIGGGLVGALCVCLLAERGYKVTLYEKRPDIRKTKLPKGRSINLALSHRGRKALKLLHIEEDILKEAIPMRGRFLHGNDGGTSSVEYDPISHQCIYSVSRNFLNRTLLNVAEKHSNVQLNFNHKLVDVNFSKDILHIKNIETNQITSISADFIVGADGAFSTLRSFLQKIPLFDFSQTFIDHGYLELSIPPERGERMDGNHLHIWPRGEFMMIALPNRDVSWTVTLFMPFKKFHALKTPKELLIFFKTTFPDALSVIGEEELEETFFSTPPSPLVSIKCGRYHAKGKYLIIGDAAHAMVPFFGQGMNAGFEDCVLLNQLLDETHNNIAKTVQFFTEQRQKDAYAICDLALYNYMEMRDLVTKPSFKIRKVIDKYLAKMCPDLWMPLYKSVSFSHIRYSQCVENRKWQNKVLFSAFLVLLGSFCLASVLAFI